jgi:hypothetical protein
MSSELKRRYSKKPGESESKTSSPKKNTSPRSGGVIKSQPESTSDEKDEPMSKNFQSFQSDDIDTAYDDDVHEFIDDLNSPTSAEYIKSKSLINRCEGAFRQLQLLKDSWVRITIKNVKISDVKLQLPSMCYLGYVLLFSVCCCCCCCCCCDFRLFVTQFY